MLTSDSKSVLIDVTKLVVRLPLADDKPGQCHGCASLNAKLHRLRDYFQSEIDSLKERLPNFAANSDFSLSQSSLLASEKLLKKNLDLRQRLCEIESSYENPKADAKFLRDKTRALLLRYVY